jgi:hypothetical protein
MSEQGVDYPNPILAAAAAARENRLDDERRAATAKAALVAQPLTEASAEDVGAAGRQLREYASAALKWRKSLRSAGAPGRPSHQEIVEAEKSAGQDRDAGPIILTFRRPPPAPGEQTPNHSPAKEIDEIVDRTKAKLAAIDRAKPTTPTPAKDWCQLAPFMEHVFDLPQPERDLFLDLFTSHPNTLFLGIEKLENGDIEFAYADFDHVFFGTLFDLLSVRAKKRATGAQGRQG